MKDWVNSQVFLAIVRNLASSIAGYLVLWDVVQAGEQQTQLTGLIVGAVTLAASIISARFKKQAIDAAGGKEAVKETVAAEKVARSLSN